MAASLPVQKWNLHNTFAPNINMILAATAQILWIPACLYSVGPQMIHFPYPISDLNHRKIFLFRML